MIELGMVFMLTPFVNVDYVGRAISKPVPSKVVYINEPHRFFTVEFKFPSGCHYRESFKFDEVEGGNA